MPANKAAVDVVMKSALGKKVMKGASTFLFSAAQQELVRRIDASAVEAVLSKASAAVSFSGRVERQRVRLVELRSTLRDCVLPIDPHVRRGLNETIESLVVQAALLPRMAKKVRGKQYASFVAGIDDVSIDIMKAIATPSATQPDAQ